jgi:Protein of unknown function (DUF2568)
VNAFKGVLLAVRFALEIGAFISLGYWGFATGENLVVDLVLGLGAPLVAIVLWGVFVSPKARLGSPMRQALFEAIVFGGAVLALVHAGQSWLALAFGAIAVADSVLLRVVGRDLSPP